MYGHKRNCPSGNGIIISEVPGSLALPLLFSLDMNVRSAVFLEQQDQGQACDQCLQEFEALLLISCSFTCILAPTLPEILWKDWPYEHSVAELDLVGSCQQREAVHRAGEALEGQQPRFVRKITPGAAALHYCCSGMLLWTLCLGCDPSFIGGSLHLLNELWRCGHNPFPWVSLHSPVHGLGATDAKNISVLLQEEEEQQRGLNKCVRVLFPIKLINIIICEQRGGSRDTGKLNHPSKHRALQILPSVWFGLWCREIQQGRGTAVQL